MEIKNATRDALFAATIHYIQRITLPLGDTEAYRKVYWGEPQRSLLIACEQGLENPDAISIADYQAKCHTTMVAWRNSVRKARQGGE